MTGRPWRWVSEAVVFAIHDAQIAEHGGGAGVRETALMQSALARPRNLSAAGTPDAAALATAYAFGIARNHGLSMTTNAQPLWSPVCFLFTTDSRSRRATLKLSPAL